MKSLSAPGNPGRTHAIEAARTVGGAVAVPDFGDDRPADATDFNDLARLRGLSALLTAIEAGASIPQKVANDSDTNAAQSAWPDPEPLTAPIESRSYPVEALPPLLRDAVIEAQAFVQSPAALVACSALSALSIAAQGIVNVRRDPQLAGPVSLYLPSVAESGERKTTFDRIFGAALRRTRPRTIARWLT